MKSKKYTYGCGQDIAFELTVKAKSDADAEKKLEKKLRKAEKEINKILRGTGYLALGFAEAYFVEEEANT